ncbi:hypothetical protein A8A01_23190 [Ewingella americana]|nr:hypothetical protein A8A01_23190 [Ewingella americana]
MTSTNKIMSTNPRLASLLSDVERGNIKIPVFQRDYVWNDEQIMSLLDSIYSGYPVGSLLLWSTKEILNHERNVGSFILPSSTDDYPVSYVLDGQQRLTTLYGVFNSDKPTNDSELAKRFDVCFVPSTHQFIHSSAADPSTSINMNVILDTTKLLPQLARFKEPSDQKSIATLTEKFKDYEFPVVTIKERTNQEVCRVFQRINSSGTRLSTLELLSAWTWSEQFNLRNEIESLLDSISDRGYEQLDEALLMRCLTAIVNGGIDSDSLVDAPPEVLISSMTSLKQSLYATIDFLDSELKIKNVVFLPFPIMLVPLVSFFSKNLRPDSAQLVSLKKWFWFCSFSQKYKAGTNTFVVEDIKKLEKLANTPSENLVFNNDIDGEMFKKSWRINSTAAKATICLLAQLQPKSFITGKNVDLGQTMSAYNSRQFHHIYPKASLARIGINFHESNVIANICFLTAEDNLKISDNDPKDYFPTIPDNVKNEVFHSSLIPESTRDGSKTFSEFIALRSKSLEELAKKAIITGSV